MRMRLIIAVAFALLVPAFAVGAELVAAESSLSPELEIVGVSGADPVLLSYWTELGGPQFVAEMAGEAEITVGHADKPCGLDAVGCAMEELSPCRIEVVPDAPDWVYLHEVGHCLGFEHADSGIMAAEDASPDPSVDARWLAQPLGR